MASDPWEQGWSWAGGPGDDGPPAPWPRCPRWSPAWAPHPSGFSTPSVVPLSLTTYTIALGGQPPKPSSHVVSARARSSIHRRSRVLGPTEVENCRCRSARSWRPVRQTRRSPVPSADSVAQCGLVVSQRCSRWWVLSEYWSGPGSPNPAGATLKLTYWARTLAVTFTDSGATFWLTGT